MPRLVSKNGGNAMSSNSHSTVFVVDADRSVRRRRFPYQGIIEAISVPVVAFVIARLSESHFWR
jgi:hypothetical protein